MYVMTPFTSLLVLENEAMYKEYKVDRGRKDHWAMYPCPEKIPVVYEPDPTMPTDVRNAPKGLKPTANEVSSTVLIRSMPTWLETPSPDRKHTISAGGMADLSDWEISRRNTIFRTAVNTPFIDPQEVMRYWGDQKTSSPVWLGVGRSATTPFASSSNFQSAARKLWCQ